ncbi:hypothetical protein LTR05_002032 [Lithohypha guttulata]|uniref:Uncharacterized protein n=1 Tax=Lithohypha guttulata TaxID=1690604 RepID=A0AAN7T1K3_9EURO|nr:hypothetical protein LTR05_002032 [Lithohypha guttulata]
MSALPDLYGGSPAHLGDLNKQYTYQPYRPPDAEARPKAKLVKSHDLSIQAQLPLTDKDLDILVGRGHILPKTAAQIRAARLHKAFNQNKDVPTSSTSMKRFFDNSTEETVSFFEPTPVAMVPQVWKPVQRGPNLERPANFKFKVNPDPEGSKKQRMMAAADLSQSHLKAQPQAPPKKIESHYPKSNLLVLPGVAKSINEIRNLPLTHSSHIFISVLALLAHS